MSISLLYVPHLPQNEKQPTNKATNQNKTPGNYFSSCERTMKNIKHLQTVYSVNKYEFSLWNQCPQRRVISAVILNAYKNITFFLVKDKS